MPPVKNLGSVIEKVSRNPPPGLIKFLDRMEIGMFGAKWMTVGYVFYNLHEISQLREAGKELDRAMDRHIDKILKKK